SYACTPVAEDEYLRFEAQSPIKHEYLNGELFAMTRSDRGAVHNAFISFFNSVKNRQSVPCAMSFCGVDLIIPTSCRRNAWKRIVSSGFASRQRLYGRLFTTSAPTW